MQTRLHSVGEYAATKKLKQGATALEEGRLPFSGGSSDNILTLSVIYANVNTNIAKIKKRIKMSTRTPTIERNAWDSRYTPRPAQSHPRRSQANVNLIDMKR